MFSAPLRRSAARIASVRGAVSRASTARLTTVHAPTHLAAGTALFSSSSSGGAEPYKHNLDEIIDARTKAAREEFLTLTEAFLRYDGDGNGHLDREELAAALSDLNIPTGKVSADELFETLDANKDGAIQLTEWLDHLPKGTRFTILDKFGGETGSHRLVQMYMPTRSKIVYTKTDEAPMLATYSLLPIIRSFTNPANIEVDYSDISLAGRILANFPDFLQPDQRVNDHLSQLGELAKTPAANIVKLPNISASIPQLCEAIAELQDKGYTVPDYPLSASTSEEEKIKARYAKVLGSAVNPVLREGNSDRRVAGPVKVFAQTNPHRMYPWSENSKTHVSHMAGGDFFGNEKSTIVDKATTVRIELLPDGENEPVVLKASTSLQAGEVIDSSCMDVAKLEEFIAGEIDDAKADGVLFSLHLKATMMKVSDPIMFGHVVKVFYRDVIAKHAALFDELGVNYNNGIGDMYAKIADLPEAKRNEIEADMKACYESRPELAMVDSDRGITNLHAPNDIIIDASVPPVIRDGGKMWGPDGELHDTKMIIPDRCYATMYQEIVADCQKNGIFDVATMGNVSNVGLMAQKAEEYGSHDKTFEAAQKGVIRVVDTKDDSVLLQQNVGQGDIWRMCQTKDSPIQDWVKLAVTRARATSSPAVFWLNEERAHDRSIISKFNTYIKDHDTSDIEIHVMPPAEAMKFTLERCRAGKDTISVTGNVLRDYLTDLFPILELGTSAKMLSIVPLLAGGGLFETGAGGSAPKHVQQLVKENHLRWDSLGEFLALAVSIEDIGTKTGNDKALVVAEALNAATGKVLTNNVSPKRKVNELDNRGSHFYLAMYWAEALANQTKDPELAAQFVDFAADLKNNEQAILDELIAVQGEAADIGGYYMPDDAKATSVMRPSPILNAIIDRALGKGASDIAA